MELMSSLRRKKLWRRRYELKQLKGKINEILYVIVYIINIIIKILNYDVNSNECLG